MSGRVTISFKTIQIELATGRDLLYVQISEE